MKTRYRDKQLLLLREEVLDLEDFSESVALNEFTLDDFRIELAKYIEANRKLLEDTPLGLYAVVPPHPEDQVIAPGVVFCLKQKGDATGGETVNPLQPYYLVYVRDDNTVRFSFAHSPSGDAGEGHSRAPASWSPCGKRPTDPVQGRHEYALAPESHPAVVH